MNREEKKEYQKKYQREYYQRPEAKTKRKEYREKNKEKINKQKREYSYIPEVKKKRKEYNKEYHQRPKFKVKRKEYEKIPEVKKRIKEYRLKRKYNLTLKQLNTLLIKQDNKCAICNCLFGKIKLNKPSVDHNHSTKKIRGVLCNNCNTGLGFFKDNISNLNSAIKYLKENDKKD